MEASKPSEKLHDPKSHADNCDWHFDQYPWECTCTPNAKVMHTPGPWLAADKPSSAVGWPVVQQGVGRLICKVNYVQVTAIEPAVGGENKFNRESKANASLIAAAPELLEALKEVVAISDRNHNAWIKAHAAIAKAEGAI